MRILIVLSAILLMVSCSPGSIARKKLRRAEKLILQAEALGAHWQHDTVMVTKTITIPGISVDTTIQFDRTFGPADSANTPPQTFAIERDSLLEGVDVVNVDKGKLHVQATIQWRGKKARIKAKCDSDTVYVSMPTTITNTLEAPPCVQKYSWWKIIGACLISLAAGCLIGRLWK
jgi:hypothetical protein